MPGNLSRNIPSNSNFIAMLPNMDPDLANVIRQALGDAQAAGKDHIGQTMLAAQAVQRARPDMTASDALASVNLVHRE